MGRRLLGGLGALLTAATAVVVFAPDVAAEQVAAVAARLESRDPRRLLLALGAVVGLYAAWSARSGSARPPAPVGPSAPFEGVGDPPERVTAADRPRTGRTLDERVADAVAGDPAALASVRATLAGTAEAAHARRADCSPEAATRAVETGAWTADQTAAAFLATEGGPAFPLGARLRKWLDPEAERRRRIERTVAALEDPFDAGSTGDGGEAT
ncbi:DUF7269 family protein [Halorussus marinus]|uniref:DUF7269 family protein n=1 Tax=Halorussus marinus TaxID=2505976 RepID=UPI00106E399F|nr:hypothetical protein [Halorussus marinus]